MYMYIISPTDFINVHYIPVRGWIKEATRVDNIVIPQHTGWISMCAYQGWSLNTYYNLQLLCIVLGFCISFIVASIFENIFCAE